MSKSLKKNFKKITKFGYYMYVYDFINIFDFFKFKSMQVLMTRASEDALEQLVLMLFNR